MMRPNEWMNEWMNKWMNKLMNKYTNVCIIEWLNEWVELSGLRTSYMMFLQHFRPISAIKMNAWPTDRQTDQPTDQWTNGQTLSRCQDTRSLPKMGLPKTIRRSKMTIIFDRWSKDRKKDVRDVNWRPWHRTAVNAVGLLLVMKFSKNWRWKQKKKVKINQFWAKMIDKKNHTI